jgi:hypothetical protein
VDERELVSAIEQEIATSIGHWDGTLASEREKELKYYNGEPFGNEVEGSSQVISMDVSDTVEGLLPSILRTFTSSDDAVRFEPNGPEDEEECAQQTEWCNYVFYRQNNGFIVAYEWIKDALIQKNGIVKYWWEEKKEVTKESYFGLTEGQYLMLKQNQSIEFISKKFYDDPEALAQLQQAQTMIAQLPEPQRSLALSQLPPAPKLYDCVLKITKDVSQIRIEAIPPEEFGISSRHNCVSIQQTPFCYHRTRKSVSSLRAEGCPDEILSKMGTDSPRIQDPSPEALARDRFLDNQWVSTRPMDDTQREVWVTECFYRVDYDGDGIGELRHIIMPGREIWVNEEAEHINFAAITPIIMPHRWTGRSISELTMDIQFTKSVLQRQMLDNLYLTNNPRKAVLSTAGGIVHANLDDLMVSRAGGIMREYVAGAIRNEEIPFVAGASFPMLEYLDGVKESRTGVTRYTQGLDPDSQNKTAHGIALIQNAGQVRQDLIARIIAETGFKDLFRGIVYMSSKYQQKSEKVKLRNKWVDVDPRGWKTQYNMTVNVGLGTGNRDTELAHLRAVHAAHIELMQTGRGYMVSDENIYNLYKRTTQAMGFKNPELFITDPQLIPPQAKQPPPDPAAMKVQADSQEGQAKLQFGQWKENINAKLMEMLEQIKAQTAIEIAKMDNASKERIALMDRQANAQIEVFKASQAKPADKSMEKYAADLDAAVKKYQSDLDSATKLKVAQIGGENKLETEKLKGDMKQDQVVIDSTGSVGKGLNGALDKMSKNIAEGAKEQTKVLKEVGQHLATTAQLLASKAGDEKSSDMVIEDVQLGPDGIIKSAKVKRVH